MPDLGPANQQRTARRMVRSQLIAGELTLYQALVHPAMHGATVSAVLASLPRWSPERAERLLADMDPWPISPTRRCGQLTIRECHMIGERAGR